MSDILRAIVVFLGLIGFGFGVMFLGYEAGRKKSLEQLSAAVKEIIAAAKIGNQLKD